MTGLRRFRGWAAVFALGAVSGWLLAPTPQPGQRLVAPRRDDWKLPALPPHADDNAAAALVATAPYWGSVAKGAAPASAAATEDKRWRIAGIFGDRSQRGVLVTFAAPGHPPQNLFAGDKLPSGDRIVKVEERELCVRLGRKNYRLGVERIEP